MLRRLTNRLLIITALILFTTSCQQEEYGYHYHYIGLYDAEIEKVSTTMQGSHSSVSHKIIRVEPSSNHGLLKLMGVDVSVAKSGAISIESEGAGYRYFGGRFAGHDSLYVTINYGGLAQYTTLYYRARKIR